MPDNDNTAVRKKGNPSKAPLGFIVPFVCGLVLGYVAFILQVGSFKQMESADRVKAQLALLGISADIQRVVIDGQDIRYRVRAGPYTDQQTLDNERRRLQENNLEFMILKLQPN